jgi:protoporphyrinogen oxidase
MMKKTKIKTAIVGAGLTGLTTAFYLKKAGIDFQVLKKTDHTGGVIQTHHGKTVLHMNRGPIPECFRDPK